MLTELPYFYDARITDLSPSDVLRKDVVLQKLEWEEESNQFIKNTLKISQKYMDEKNPFLMALIAFTEGESAEATKRMVQENPEYSKNSHKCRKI